MKTDHLLFGAAYYSEYLPYDRVEKDMALMAKAGMNTIRIAESTWSTIEPQDGRFDFTHLDKMLAASAKYGISVIVGTPTYAIPTWLAKKYPDILAVTDHGANIYGARQNMDITHAGYRFHCERVIRAIMEHIRDVPHIIGFQLDNETKSYGTAGPRVQAMFVEYLKEKYPDLETFNHEFGFDYWSNRINAWEDFPDVRGTINQSFAAEFAKFQRLLVTDFLKWQADIISEYKRPDQFITQNFDFAWTDHSIGYQPEVNQYEAANATTVAGCDIYHPSQSLLTGEEITFCGNISRSLKKDNYLVLETQAQGNIAWLPYPGQLRLQAYSHIANGANSIMYWHWHSIHNAIESYWKGVLSHDFSENETYREACTIGDDFKRIGAHIKNLKKKNRVAILLDNNSLTGLRLFPIGELGEHSYNAVARWIGDTLYRMNIEYDMISSAERDFSSYDCVIAPALYSASDALLDALTGYVRNGGHLIATFRSAFCDEQLKIHCDMQPHILHECLGIHYDQYTYPQNVQITLSDGSKSDCKCWMDMVCCDTARPLFFYEHPAWKPYAAAAVNEYGQGSALYLASMFDQHALEKVLRDYFNSFSPEVLANSDCHFPVIIKDGTNDFGKNVRFYFNYSDTEQHVVWNGCSGTELLSGASATDGDTLRLAPWGFIIVEY